MSSKSTLRIIADVTLFLLVFWGPWWLVVLGMVFSLIYFDWYIEAVVLSFIMDALYGIGGVTNYLLTLSAGVLISILLYVKQWVKIESSY